MRSLSPLTAACLVVCLLAGPTAVAGPGRAGPPMARELPAPAGQGLPTPAAQARDRLPPPARETPGGERLDQARSLARQFPRELEIDREHGLRVRGEILALEPSAVALEAAVAEGFRIGATRAIEPLGLRTVVLLPKPRMSTRSALARLRKLDPAGVYTFNHVYLGSAAAGRGPAAPGLQVPPARALRVGLVDGGVDASHPALAGTRVQAWGCDGRRQPSEHGTAVASLLAGEAGGPAPGAALYAADIYCGQPTGGSVLQLVEALAWLASERVAVVNISLVGPDNPLLSKAVQRMRERGHVLVSAVGNDGPRSPPLFPAAYPHVIGVTAVDDRGRLLPEAVRGPHARFAAPGARLRAAAPGGEWQQVRGTSFASALVARRAAEAVESPHEDALAATVARLQALAGPGSTPGLAILATAPASE